MEEATLASVPDPVSSPGLGRVRLIVAVPFFLFRVTAPRANVLVGSIVA
jgi:hypothetical protein